MVAAITDFASFSVMRFVVKPDVPLSLFPLSLPPDDFPKPHISAHPETATALRGTNVTLSCVASSSSDSPMATAWRKDGEVLYDGQVENYARYQQGELSYTTVLHLLSVNFTDEGLYQCVVTNHFGSNYSHRARLTVNGEAPPPPAPLPLRRRRVGFCLLLLLL